MELIYIKIIVKQKRNILLRYLKIIFTNRFKNNNINKLNKIINQKINVLLIQKDHLPCFWLKLKNIS